jgi:hypothetical protein
MAIICISSADPVRTFIWAHYVGTAKGNDNKTSIIL